MIFSRIKSLTGNRRIAIIGACLLVGLGLCALFAWPVQKKAFTVYATLPTQEKMEVHASMESQWPWTPPDRLTELRVLINGKLANVPTDFFKAVHPIDFSRKLTLSDWRGYPEILMWGKAGSSLQEAHWRFMNDSFSELRLKQTHGWKSQFHSEPLPSPEVIVAPQAPSPQLSPSAPTPNSSNPPAPKKTHKDNHK